MNFIKKNVNGPKKFPLKKLGFSLENFLRMKFNFELTSSKTRNTGIIM